MDFGYTALRKNQNPHSNQIAKAQQAVLLRGLFVKSPGFRVSPKSIDRAGAFFDSPGDKNPPVGQQSLNHRQQIVSNFRFKAIPHAADLREQIKELRPESMGNGQ